MPGTAQIRLHAEEAGELRPPLLTSTTADSPSSTDAISCSTTLKRVNTPPRLDFLALMSSDASAMDAAGHRRSHSAVADQRSTHMAPHEKSMRPMTSASAMTALQMGLESMRSPCFVHKTFGASINLERVLDECRAEEMTHHNLLQTATGVREVARQLGILCSKFGGSNRG
jgi:hypothetical protein